MSSRSSLSQEVDEERIDHEVPRDASGEAATGGTQELERTGEVSCGTPQWELASARDWEVEFATAKGWVDAEGTLPGPLVNWDLPKESEVFETADVPLCTIFNVIFNLAEFELTGGEALGSGCSLEESGILAGGHGSFVIICENQNKKLNQTEIN